ncbi:MAG: DUF364 domain-containing protein [Thermodesulfobacteriota bacterium]
MGLNDEFKKLIIQLASRIAISPIADIFFPPFYKGGQPNDAEFMAVCLEGGAAGISYVLIPDEKADAYTALRPSAFIGKDPRDFALEFGSDDPLNEMISLACINAICQQVMREIRFPLDTATDSLGLLSVSPGDRVGMVGLFLPLINTIQNTGAQLVIVEKKAVLVQEFPRLPITLDTSELGRCNKIICTSTAVLNHSLDNILLCCSPQALIAVIGPTAGYFPDALFARGVDVVGGRVVKNGRQFLQLLAEKKRWGAATRKICFRKETYAGISP